MPGKNKYTYIFTAILALLHLVGTSQVVQENFDHGSIAVSEGNCWEYDDVDIDDNDPFTGGVAEPYAEAQIFNLFGANADLTSPFVYFDGTGAITFKHKMSSNLLVYANLSVVLVDPAGNVFSEIFDYTYSIFTNPSNSRNVAINVTWTGYYKVRWEWTALGSGDGCLDDAIIHGNFSADPLLEYRGYCPAVMEAERTVCVGLEDDYLTTLYPRGSRNYTWTFNGLSGGAIDGTITANDASVEVDWQYTTGNYILYIEESANGNYAGNQTFLTVTVEDGPGLSVSLDTVCENASATLVITSAAAMPYEISYSDDFGNHSIISNNSSTTLMLDPNTSFVDFTGLVDANGCGADPATLPNLNIYYYPAPLTGAIYH